MAKNEIFSGDLQQVPNNAVCRGLVVIQILIPGKRKSAGEICTLALRMDGAGTKQRHLQPARVSFVQQKSTPNLGAISIDSPKNI